MSSHKFGNVYDPYTVITANAVINNTRRKVFLKKTSFQVGMDLGCKCIPLETREEAAIRFSHCFCIFTDPSLVEMKFFQKAYFLYSFCSFWGVSKPTFKYNSFYLDITRQSNAFIASDGRALCWTRTLLVLEMNTLTS